jgi:hypothetical protein
LILFFSFAENFREELIEAVIHDIFETLEQDNIDCVAPFADEIQMFANSENRELRKMALSKNQKDKSSGAKISGLCFLWCGLSYRFFGCKFCYYVNDYYHCYCYNCY